MTDCWYTSEDKTSRAGGVGSTPGSLDEPPGISRRTRPMGDSTLSPESLVSALPNPRAAGVALGAAYRALVLIREADSAASLARLDLDTALVAYAALTRGFDVVRDRALTWLASEFPWDGSVSDAFERALGLDLHDARAEEIAQLRAIPYAEYLRTEHWQRKRSDAIGLAGNRCRICNAAPSPTNLLDVHHRTYENRGNEERGDLTVLCRDCHERFHDRLPVPPRRSMWGDDE